MYNPNPSPLTDTEAHSMYPTKLTHPSSMKDPTVLETPKDETTLTEGVTIQDMISGRDHGRNIPVWTIFLSAAAGIGFGVLLANVGVSEEARKWVSFPGDLFIAALNCMITPMIFCIIVMCIGDLIHVGKAAAIGGRTVLYFILCSVTASTVGVLTGFFFQPAFRQTTKVASSSHTIKLTLTCNSGALMTMGENGLVSCDANPPVNSTFFALNDTTSYFKVQTNGYTSLSVSEQIFGILNNLVPDNIVNAFATSQTLSIITFAVVFGLALNKTGSKGRDGENYPLLLIDQATVMWNMMISKIFVVFPIAIISMIAGSVADSSNSTNLLENVGFLVTALFIGLATHMIGVLGIALFVTTRRNVFSWMRHIIPAQIFIFGCSSSVGTLPVTLRCVEMTREVSPSLARFVLTLGATSNLNGTAIFMPLAVIFMATVSGNEDQLTPLTYVMLAFVGTIASFGVAPVPHAGLAMMITIWRTVMGLDLPPQAFSIIVGTDWLLVRMRSVVNITNDTIVCRIIAHQCDEAVEAQLGGHKEEPLGTPPSPPAASV